MRWRLFTQPFILAQIKENIKAPRHWLWEGNSVVTGEFPAQMASNAENVSIWWRCHVWINSDFFLSSYSHTFRLNILESYLSLSLCYIHICGQSDIDRHRSVFERERVRSMSNRCRPEDLCCLGYENIIVETGSARLPHFTTIHSHAFTECLRSTTYGVIEIT